MPAERCLKRGAICAIGRVRQARHGAKSARKSGWVDEVRACVISILSFFFNVLIYNV